MTKQEQRAYENGRRIAEHVVGRIGQVGAATRGSLAHVRYTRDALRKAYDQGYWDVLLGL